MLIKGQACAAGYYLQDQWILGLVKAATSVPQLLDYWYLQMPVASRSFNVIMTI